MSGRTDGDLQALMEKGLQAHQAGRLADAEAAYRRVLGLDADHADANHLLGVIAHQVGDHGAAVELIGKAISSFPTRRNVTSTAAYHNNLGTALHELGRLDEAAASQRQAIALNPDYSKAHNNLANVLLAQGCSIDAVASYRKALSIVPDDAGTHVNLGTALHELGRLDEAEASYRKALALDPDYARAHTSLGNTLQETGRLEDAVASHQQALSINPDYAEAHANLGNALKELGHLEDAAASHEKALSINPDYTEAHFNLGNAQHQQGRFEEALASHEKALALKPDFAEAHSNKGVILMKLGRSDDAVASYRRAIEIRPDYDKAHFNLGKALNETGRLEDAVASYRQAIALNPDYAKALNNLGMVYKEQGRLDEAAQSHEKALAVNPDYAEALTNLGNVRQNQDRLEDAVASHERALAIKPDFPQALNNLSGALDHLERREEGEAACRRAIELKPDYAEAHVNLALFLFRKGRLKEAWDEYEWRWRSENSHLWRDLPQTLWQGEDLAGKTVLVWAEQGVGDEIMFAGMIPDLIETGARVTLECDHRLVPLYQRSFPGVECIARGESAILDTCHENINFQVPVGNLGRWFRANLVSFPKRSSFLKADKDRTVALKTRYQEIFPDKHIIGLSWRSGSQLTGAGRSIPLADWLPILSNPRCAFVNLQYGDVEEELDGLRRDHGIDILRDPDVDPFRDIDGLASQIAAMDSVFSIASITLQLAGALGVPTWALLMKMPDCRWMLDRDDSPWNPEMRLFRQEARNDWAGVIERISKALNERFKN